MVPRNEGVAVVCGMPEFRSTSTVAASCGSEVDTKREV